MDLNKMSLTLMTNQNQDISNYRKIKNRMDKFVRQTQIQTPDLPYPPAKAVKEINRLSKMAKYYRLNFSLIHNINIQNIKKEINQWDKYKNHYEKVTELDWINNKRPLNDLQKTVLLNLEEKQAKARRYQFLYRLNLEMEQAINNRWYIIFNTLTVAPEYNKMVWDNESPAFNSYLKRWDRISGVENHKYFAVTEFGSKTSREHIHSVHFIKDLPEQAKQCPNRLATIPTRRIVEAFRTYWKYGFSAPIAVRTTASDPWAKIGYRWPVKFNKEKQWEPIDSGCINKLANYMTKYITKSISIKGDQKWKTRQSQNLGMTILHQSLDALSQKQLNQFQIIMKMRVLAIHQKIIPTQLMMIAYYKKMNEQLKKNKNKITQIMTRKPAHSIMRRLNDLTQPIPLYNLRNIGDSPIQKSKTVETSEIIPIQNIIDTITIQITGFLESPTTHEYIKGVSKHG